MSEEQVIEPGALSFECPFCYSIAAARLLAADFVVSDCGNKIDGMYTLFGARFFKDITCGLKKDEVNVDNIGSF